MIMPKLESYVCLNSDCRYNFYAKPDFYFSYFAPCRESFPYCHSELYIYPKNAKSNGEEREDHLFLDCIREGLAEAKAAEKENQKIITPLVEKIAEVFKNTKQKYVKKNR